MDETTDIGPQNGAPAHLPPTSTHLSSFAPIQIDVPPPLAEESEADYAMNSSGSDTNSALPPTGHGAAEKTAESGNISSSRTPLLPDQAK